MTPDEIRQAIDTLRWEAQLTTTHRRSVIDTYRKVVREAQIRIDITNRQYDRELTRLARRIRELEAQLPQEGPDKAPKSKDRLEDAINAYNRDHGLPEVQLTETTDSTEV